MSDGTQQSATSRKYLLVPPAFFSLRNDDTAMVSSKAMYVLTFICYATTLTVFLALLITGLHTSTTETKVSLSDITDDEWSCQMMNRVTQSYLLNNSIPPPINFPYGSEGEKLSIYSNLYAVSELYSDCVQALQITQPCQFPDSFFYLPGASTAWSIADDSVSIATFQNSLVYIGFEELSEFYRYNLTSGQVTLSPFEFHATTVAVDSQGQGYSLVPCVHTDTNEQSVTCIANFDGDVVYMMDNDIVNKCRNCLIVALFNDNDYHMYYLFQCDSNPDYSTNYQIYELIPSTTTSTSTYIFDAVFLTNVTSFTMGIGATSAYRMAITSFDSMTQESVSIYYFQSGESPDGSIVSDLFRYQYNISSSFSVGVIDTGALGFTTLLAENLPYYPVYSSQVLSPTTSTNLSLYFTTTTPQLRRIDLTFLQQQASTPSGTSTTTTASAIVTVTSTAVMASTSPIVRLNWNIFSFFSDGIHAFTAGSPSSSFDESSYFFRFYLTTNSTEVVSNGYIGTQSGWFTCGDTIINSTVVTSSSSAGSSGDDALLHLCYANGLTWSIDLLSSYTFTYSDMMSYSNNLANSLCMISSAGGKPSYNQVCNLILDQPPYICSRDLYQPFFTVLSTALANAHFLLVILTIICSSQVIPVVAKFYPPDRMNNNNNEVDVKEVELNEQHNPIQ